MADSNQSPSSATNGVRICVDTLDEIRGYEDCRVVTEGCSGKTKVYIETREEKLSAYIGDWIMEDSEGHHYPIADEEIGQNTPNKMPTDDRTRQERLETALYDVMTFLKEEADRPDKGRYPRSVHRTASDICEQNGLDPITAHDLDE